MSYLIYKQGKLMRRERTRADCVHWVRTLIGGRVKHREEIAPGHYRYVVGTQTTQTWDVEIVRTKVAESAGLDVLQIAEYPFKDILFRQRSKEDV